MSVILDFGTDPAKTLRKKLSEFWQQSASEGQQAERTNEQLRGYQAWGRNHPTEPPKGAA